VSAPDQPPLVKFAIEKPGDTTPMNTSSSKIASSVTHNSKVAAICTPTMFSVMNTMYAPTAAVFGSRPGKLHVQVRADRERNRRRRKHEFDQRCRAGQITAGRTERAALL
jgi:hypothetical protein